LKALNRTFLFLFVFCCRGLFAQNFRPFTVLHVIETEHFEIIYPSESEETARTLAGCADSLYEKVSSSLGLSLSRKVPVSITPHTEEFNGYMNPMPFFHIFLFDTPIDPEWTGFENSLEDLFIHEMSHAVSMSVKNPFYTVLHRIFGAWVYPPAMTVPRFMTEGVAVKFESSGGGGRANDPLIRQTLVQAHAEGAFLSPFQASGVWDLPAGSHHYNYGAYFSSYLEERYGPEKYAELWQALGRLYHFSFFFYNFNFYNAFRRVYGEAFLDVWKDFEKNFELEGLEDNAGGRLSGKRQLISATASGGGKIFVFDRIRRQLIRLNAGGKEERAFFTDTSAYGIDADETGENLLVSSYRYTGSLAEAVVREYSAEGRLSGRVWRNLYSGAYFREGLAGLRAERHSNSLVYRRAPGKAAPENEEVLLRGNAELIFSRPAALNDEWLAFTALRRGKRELGLYHYPSALVYRLASDLQGDEGYWSYMRWLNVSGGRLLFGYENAGGMYKLGVIDPEKMEAVFSERNFSGGVSMPVCAGNRIFYRGAFSSWDALMQYPEDAGSLSGRRASLHLVPWNTEERLEAGLKPEGEALPPPAVSSGNSPLKSRLYNPVKYLNPFRFWVPYPLIREVRGGNYSFDGGGFFSYLSDAADLNTANLYAALDARSWMAYTDISWTNLNLGFPLRIHFQDDIDRTGLNTYRVTWGSLSTSANHYLWDDRNRLGFRAEMVATAYALDPENGSSAYTWKYGDRLYFNYGGGLEFSNLRRLSWESFGQGLRSAIFARFTPDPLPPRLETYLETAFEPFFPAQLNLYGAWDTRGMNLQGESRNFTGSIFSSVSAAEYSNPEINALSWIYGGQAEFRLFQAEIQKNISHLYYNRLIGTLAYRAALYDSRDIKEIEGTPLGGDYALTQSALFRLALSASTVFITAVPLKFTPSIYIVWRASNVNNGVFSLNDDFRFGFFYSMEY
jgi:hypothetical protein